MSTIPATSAQHGGLQAANYFNWALQRTHELGDDRCVRCLWPAFRLVRYGA